jgi:uncharacterized membrane protein
MDKEIVIIVSTEASAYEVVRALRALDDEGSIELYSSIVVEKSSDGTLQVKETRDDRGPFGAVLGLSTGALVGLIGGPVGAAVGAVVGAAAGLGRDIAYSGFQGDFVHDVSSRLEPGTYAVCASVLEDWTEPVDVSIRPFGGTILRQSTEDLVVAQIRAEMQALREEMAHVEAEIARSRDEARTKLVQKREELRVKQKAQRDRLEKRARALQANWDAKIASIGEKARAARADARARHEHHMQQLGRFADLQKQSFHELFS